MLDTRTKLYLHIYSVVSTLCAAVDFIAEGAEGQKVVPASNDTGFDYFEYLKSII